MQYMYYLSLLSICSIGTVYMYTLILYHTHINREYNFRIRPCGSNEGMRL